MTGHSETVSRPRTGVDGSAPTILASTFWHPLGDADRGNPDCACADLRVGAPRHHRAVAIGARGAAVRAAARLMATGMPISIALGLSVLTYLFILSSVDPKMVGLKLFTSIDRFEIMAIPFFILAGNSSRRRCSAAHDRLRDLDDRALVWRPRLAGVVACALFAAISAPRRDGGRHRLHHPAGDRAERLSAAFGAGVIATSGALGILFPRRSISSSSRSRPAACSPRAGWGHRRLRLDWSTLHRRAGARADARHHAGHDTWYRAWRNDYPRMPRASWGECLRAFPMASGACS